MSNDEGYRNPNRAFFEDMKKKHPDLATYADYALANMNDIDPATVLARLPPRYPLLWRETFVRAQRLTPLIQRAVDAHCYIEALVLCHGMIQICLRTQYVCAWQRTVPHELTEDEIKPYFAPRKLDGSVHQLVQRCETVELIEPTQAALLEGVNDARNRAAHGVIAGEIETEGLRDEAVKAQGAAIGALHALEGWFNNPRKFYSKRDGVPFKP